MSGKTKALLAAIMLGLLIAGCTTPSAPKPGSFDSFRPLIPYSVDSSQGTWATFPMGQLGNKLNTFWQLFHRQPGTSRWSNQVKATATATNGGLLLASNQTELAVAIRPSVDLTFTPIIFTVNGGSTWSNGLLDSPIARSPAAFALGPDNSGLALVENGLGNYVVESPPGLKAWVIIATRKSLDAVKGACSVDQIVGVNFLISTPLIETTCKGSNGLGVYTVDNSHPQEIETIRSFRPAIRHLQLLGSESTASATEILLQATQTRHLELLVETVQVDGSGGTPVVSTVQISLGNRSQVSSLSWNSQGDMLVLANSQSTGQLGLEYFPTRRAWSTQATPSFSASSLVLGNDGSIWEFETSGKTLQIAQHLPGATGWTSPTSTRVALQYGSSNF